MELRWTVSGILLSVLAAAPFSCERENPEEKATEAAAGIDVLNILTWNDYVAPPLVDKFRRERGIEIRLHHYSSSTEMMGLLMTYPYRYDAVIVESAVLPQLTGSGLAVELDRSKLEGMENLNEDLLSRSDDFEREFSIPYHWGATVVAYRQDKIPHPPNSFSLLFDPEYHGHVAMFDDVYESLGVVHLIEGRSINSFGESEVDSAARLLKEQVSEVAADYLCPAEIQESLLNGEVWAAMCSSGDAARMALRDPNIRYFLPREGASLWLDVASVSRDAQNVDGAYKFFSFLLEPENMAISSNYFLLPNALEGGSELLDPVFERDEILNPRGDTLAKCEFFNRFPLNVQTNLSRTFRDILKSSKGEPEALALKEELF